METRDYGTSANSHLSRVSTVDTVNAQGAKVTANGQVKPYQSSDKTNSNPGSNDTEQDEEST